MVSRFIAYINKDTSTLNQAAFVLGFFSILSQLLGLVRDRLLASWIGPGEALDVYYAAFKIPDLINVLFASLFSVTILIPFISEYAEKKRIDKLNEFLKNIFTVYVLGMVAVSTIAYITMPFLVKAIAPGFSITQFNELIVYTRIMLLSPFLLGLSSLFGAFTQVQKKFFSFAIAPLFYNVGILLGIVLLSKTFGILGVIIGVVSGAFFHMLLQLPSLRAVSVFPRFSFEIKWSLILRVVKQSIPRTIGISLSNTTFIIIGALASLLVAGSLSVFQLSYNIQTTPLAIIGISYAVAAFPTLTRLYNEKKKQDFMNLMHRAVQNILFLALPISFLFIVLRAHIVRILLGASGFTWSNTRLVAASLAVFSISIVAQGLVLLLVRGFYATGNTKTPLKVNTITVVITTSIALLGLLLFEKNELFRFFVESLLRIDFIEGGGVVILAFAFSIGQLFNALTLWILFHKQMHGSYVPSVQFRYKILHLLGASLIGATASYAVLQFFPTVFTLTTFWEVFFQAIISGLVGVILYGIILYILKNEDIVLFMKTFHSKFWKTHPINDEQPDL